jgi:hypothetical protein
LDFVISVESVSVEPAQLELAIRGRQTLVATIFPKNATNKSITWSSDKPETVSVDEKGRIRANTAGEATITATTEDGAKTATCLVTVKDNILFHISMIDFPDLSGPVNVPFSRDFDNVRAEITGIDWTMIATLEEQTIDYETAISLPVVLPADLLCKVARDSYNDYDGFWPARECSDRDAKVANLGDIVAYRGDEKVGRLYPTSWNSDNPAEKSGAWFAYFHYTDRPFTLSGTNLTAPGGDVSFTYDVSFRTGWNIYYRRYEGRRTLVTTTLPDDVSLWWRFEAWP